MATSTIRIRKVCEWCGSEFEAQKCTIRFCSKRCAEHAYKDRQRQERKKVTEAHITTVDSDSTFRCRTTAFNEFVC